jgi:hypothetical protein
LRLASRAKNILQDIKIQSLLVTVQEDNSRGPSAEVAQFKKDVEEYVAEVAKMKEYAVNLSKLLELLLVAIAKEEKVLLLLITS